MSHRAKHDRTSQDGQTDKPPDGQTAKRPNGNTALALLPLLLVFSACSDRSDAQTEEQVLEVAAEVIPRVEHAVGLTFKSQPELALKTRDEVRAYLDAKIAEELPPEEIERLTIAYRMFGLIPDTLDLAALMLELYSEQVAGYYDPDSTVLYVVEGTDPMIVRITIAHELVHALQDQYMPIDSILSTRRQNDRRIAAQSVLEGQAMLASILAMAPEQDLGALGAFWTDATRMAQIRDQEKRMPVFANAPLVIRDGLIFPYLAGADFMNWFGRVHPDTVPYGPRLPQSTEHILHPDRYGAGDTPVDLAFPEESSASYSDGLGEFETRVLLTELTGSETSGAVGALGWGGDRYAVFPAADAHALVWWSVWDSEAARERFATMLSREWRVSEAGWRHLVYETDVQGHPAVLFIYAPEGWDRWDDPPGVVLSAGA
jgi:hypothetical protein